MITAAITGLSHYLPDYVLTNDEIATMVDTNDEWITTRTGSKSRRVLKDEHAGSSQLVQCVMCSKRLERLQRK